MHFYDAELLRLRAHAYDDPATRQVDVAAALEVSRRRGATLFELRAALDDYQLRGVPSRAALLAVVETVPANSLLPEVARARVVLS